MKFRTLILTLAGAAMLALIILAGGVGLSNTPTKTYVVEGSAAKCLRTVANDPTLDIRSIDVYPANELTGLDRIARIKGNRGIPPDYLIGYWRDGKMGKTVAIKSQNTFAFREPAGRYRLWFLVSSSHIWHGDTSIPRVGSPNDAAITFSVSPNRVNRLPSYLDCASFDAWISNPPTMKSL